jgi:hypothetical protein
VIEPWNHCECVGGIIQIAGLISSCFRLVNYDYLPRLKRSIARHSYYWYCIFLLLSAEFRRSAGRLYPLLILWLGIQNTPLELGNLGLECIILSFFGTESELLNCCLRKTRSGHFSGPWWTPFWDQSHDTWSGSSGSGVRSLNRFVGRFLFTFDWCSPWNNVVITSFQWWFTTLIFNDDTTGCLYSMWIYDDLWNNDDTTS